MYPGFEIELKELIRNEIKAAFKEQEKRQAKNSWMSKLSGITNNLMLGPGIKPDIANNVFGGPRTRHERINRRNKANAGQ